MEEIIELKKYIENEQYDEALNLIGEMEEMSRDDKINKVESYMEVLLVHLIKQAAEKRTTRSWTASIRNSVEAVYRTNKRRKAGGFYLTEEELTEAADEIFDTALIHASLEAFGGAYSETELEERIDKAKIKGEALGLILARQTGAAS
jgi:hypothetical protein